MFILGSDCCYIYNLMAKNHQAAPMWKAGFALASLGEKVFLLEFVSVQNGGSFKAKFVTENYEKFILPMKKQKCAIVGFVSHE